MEQSWKGNVMNAHRFGNYDEFGIKGWMTMNNPSKESIAILRTLFYQILPSVSSNI